MSDQSPEISLEAYAAEREAGAVLVPTGQLSSRLDEIDRSARVHVICASGNRSKAMTDLLVASGFDAVSVAGGTRGWIESGRSSGVGR